MHARKEEHLYAFVRKLFREGPAFLRNQADAVYAPVVKALRHMSGELEKLRGFVRFSDYSGVLGAEIEPKNRVLPLLRRHFCNRYANESFFIYDRTHREMLLYTKGRSHLACVDSLQLELPGEEEVYYRTLWKRFSDTVASASAKIPRCQNTFMPKRYRGTMTEFSPRRQSRRRRPAAVQYAARHAPRRAVRRRTGARYSVRISRRCPSPRRSSRETCTCDTPRIRAVCSASSP